MSKFHHLTGTLDERAALRTAAANNPQAYRLQLSEVEREFQMFERALPELIALLKVAHACCVDLEATALMRQNASLELLYLEVRKFDPDLPEDPPS